MSNNKVKIDFDAVAAAFGLDRSTLPSEGVRKPVERSKRALPQVRFAPVSNEDWRLIYPLLPKLPVAKPDANYRDRDFIDATLWWINARENGFGWGKLPLQYWPISSREHRHRRWCLLGWWQNLYAAIKDRDEVSPCLRLAFKRIAKDAELRLKRAVASRERLTGAH